MPRPAMADSGNDSGFYGEAGAPEVERSSFIDTLHETGSTEK